MEIDYRPKKVARVMAVMVLALWVLSMAGSVSRFFLGYDSKVVSAFYFGYEKNFPSYYSSITLLFGAVLLAVVAVNALKNHEKYAFHWSLLSAIFVYISLDEMLALHEELHGPVKTLFHARGMLYFAWVIPFGALLIVFLLAYRKFVLDLPRKTRTLFIASGAIYVLGALGIEMLSARYYDGHGRDNFVFVMYETVEELLEMSGVILFVYAIGTHIRDHIKHVTIAFK